MNIVFESPDPCPCNIKRDQFLAARQQSGFRDLGVNSVVECDCGDQYMLTEDTGSRAWILYVPMKEARGA